MSPGDERLLLRKERKTIISLFIRSHEFPPFVRYAIFSIMVPRILSHLSSWQCRRSRRGCQGHGEFFSLRRGITIIIIIIIGECESGGLGSGDLSPDEIDIDGLSENQARIDSVLKFLLNYNCPKKNVGRPKKQAGKAVKDLNVITDASREKEQDFAFPDGVSENMKNLSDIRDVHPGVLLDYLVKLSDFNKKILQSVGTLHKKCNELSTKLCAVSTSEATNDRLPLPQTVQAQSRPAFDVASSGRSKEVELESRVDATEQRSNASILLCSGAIISEVIGADSGDLKNSHFVCWSVFAK